MGWILLRAGRPSRGAPGRDGRAGNGGSGGYFTAGVQPWSNNPSPPRGRASGPALSTLGRKPGRVSSPKGAFRLPRPAGAGIRCTGRGRGYAGGMADVTQILAAVEAGDPHAAD